MKKKSNSYAKWGYIFVAPFTIAFLIFTLYPIAYTVVLGFTDFKGLTTTTFLTAIPTSSSQRWVPRVSTTFSRRPT